MDEQTKQPASDIPADELVAMIETRRREAGDAKPPERIPVAAAIGPRRMAYRELLADDESPERAQRRQIAEAGAVLLRRAGERYKGCRLENYVSATPYQERAVAVVGEYITTIKDRFASRQGLVLYGPVGTGKDHLAYSVAVAAILAGMRVWWLNGQDWFGQIRDAMDSENTTEAGIIERVASPHFAVISDPLPPIGSLTQHQATMLYRAIDARYAAGKPTIVTLNIKNDSEADAKLGVPTWDRICDGTWKVFCNWPSYRKPARVVTP